MSIINTMEDYAEKTHKSMPDSPSGLSRREFLAMAARLSISSALLGGADYLNAENAQTKLPKYSKPTSRVLKVHNRRIIRGLKVNQLRLHNMVDESVKAYAKCDELAAAWGKIIRPDWNVLIKFTQFTGVGPSGELEMLEAILGSIKRAGFDLGKMSVAGTRFGKYHSGLRPLASGWSENTVKVGATTEQLRKYLDDIDAIINVPNLTDHVQLGVNCAMLNVSEPFIRRPGRFIGHYAHEMVTDICGASGEKKKIAPVVLNLVNALRCGYNGGPQAVGAYMVTVSELWLSEDMVALDRLAWQWIDRYRLKNGLPVLSEAGHTPDYIALAGQKGLGNNKIDAIKIEPVEL